MTKTYIVEDDFTHKGLRCVVVLHPTGYRTGYVGVPATHLLYGKDYEQRLTRREPTTIEGFFSVHGDLTYAGGGKGSDYPVQSDLWWFGFDCAHWGDAYDFAEAKKQWADDPEVVTALETFERTMPQLTPAKQRTREFVRDECVRLAEQLAGFLPHSTEADK